MVHALRVLRQHLLGVRRPQPFGCWTAWTDFDLADRQLGDRVEQNEATSEKDARPMARGDRGPRFDVTRLPGSRKTTDPLSRGSCAGGDGPAASTGDPDPESRQELFSRLGRDVPTPAQPASIRVGWANTRRSAASAFANVQGGIANPSTALCVVAGMDPKPTLPTHQSGARPRRPAQARAPPAIAVAARRDGRAGLDRRAADYGGRVRHDPEPRRHPVRLLEGPEPEARAIHTRSTATRRATDAA